MHNSIMCAMSNAEATRSKLVVDTSGTSSMCSDVVVVGHTTHLASYPCLNDDEECGVLDVSATSNFFVKAIFFGESSQWGG